MPKPLRLQYYLDSLSSAEIANRLLLPVDGHQPTPREEQQVRRGVPVLCALVPVLHALGRAGDSRVLMCLPLQYQSSRPLGARCPLPFHRRWWPSCIATWPTC